MVVELTQAQYSRHRGVTRKTVTQWKKKGKLVFTIRNLIDRDATDAVIDGFAEAPSYVADLDKVAQEKVNKNIRKRNNVTDSELSTDVDIESLEIDTQRFPPKFQSEEKKEFYLAKLRELELRKKAGELVEVEKIKKKLYELWRSERDSWLNWPQRICPELASKFGIDQNELTIEMEKLVNEHLSDRAEHPTI